jgi:hypothetical protein
MRCAPPPSGTLLYRRTPSGRHARFPCRTGRVRLIDCADTLGAWGTSGRRAGRCDRPRITTLAKWRTLARIDRARHRWVGALSHLRRDRRADRTASACPGASSTRTACAGGHPRSASTGPAATRGTNAGGHAASGNGIATGNTAACRQSAAVPGPAESAEPPASDGTGAARTANRPFDTGRSTADRCK